MLPILVTEYLPHTGLIFLLIGLIFAIISLADYPSKTNMNDLLSSTKYSNLSLSLILVGGSLLIAGSK